MAAVYAFPAQIKAVQGELFVTGEGMELGVLPLLQQGVASLDDVFLLNYGIWHAFAKRHQFRVSKVAMHGGCI